MSLLASVATAMPHAFFSKTNDILFRITSLPVLNHPSSLQGLSLQPPQAVSSYLPRPWRSHKPTFPPSPPPKKAASLSCVQLLSPRQGGEETPRFTRSTGRVMLSEREKASSASQTGSQP